MGNPVTVDSDDLEAVLQAGSPLVMVQNAIAAGTNDPAYRRCKPLFQEASERLNRLRAQAIRAPSPDEMKPMTEDEWAWVRERIRYVAEETADLGDDVIKQTIQSLEGMGRVENPTASIPTSLRKKRLIEVANKVTAIRWRAGSEWEEIGTPEMVFRLTARGNAEMDRITRERNAKK